MPLMNKELRVGSKAHDKLVEELQKKLDASRKMMSTRYEQWRRNEETFMAYIPETETDAKRRSARENAGLPQYTTIEIPYSYATVLAAHTYYTSVFLSRSPILQFSGRHGEAENQVQCVEAAMDYQVNVGNWLVPLYVWLLDPGKYGLGILGYYWDEEVITSSRFVEEPVTFLGVPLPGKFKKIMQTIQQKGYSGSRLYNVRPQDWFPDPRVAISKFQTGEYMGRYTEIPWFQVEDGKKDGKYFNVDVLADQGLRQSIVAQRDRGSAQITLPNEQGSSLGGTSDAPSSVVGHEVYWKLIPNAWGLGKGTNREMWVFTLTSDGILIGAQPAGYLHGKFPFEILEDEVDGHSMFTRSMTENGKPLNDVMTWLMNSHFFNVRKAMNDQFVIDPSMIEVKDFLNPNPGRLLRLKPTAYGRDVRSVISQLPVTDVTRNHVNDTQLVMDFAQRVSGVNDTIMGMVNSGGRKTASEVRTSTSYSANRLKTKSEYYSAMGFAPLSQQLVQTMQQNYDRDMKMRLVGDLAQFGRQFIDVTPDSISGFYDFVPVDGTLPIDRFAQANLWQTLLGQIRNIPQIGQGYDLVKIFGWVAQLAGLKNIQQFRVQVVPDAQMLASAQAGNSVPVSPNIPNINEPGQIPGMGATG